MDSALGGHGTATFGDQLSAALLRQLALEDEYKSATEPASHHFYHQSRHDIYASRPGLDLKNGYMCALIDYAEGDTRGFVDDDVDADSDDASDTLTHLSHDKREKRSSKMPHTAEARGAPTVPGTTTGAGAVLGPTDGDAQLSFRITRIPYDLPDLLPDKETTSTTTSLTSPPTPISVEDIFQPLSSLSVPDLEFNLPTPPQVQAAGCEPSGPSMSPATRIPRTADSGKHVSPRKFSFDGPDEIDVTKGRLALAPSTSATRNLASAHSTTTLRTRTAGSSDDPPASQKWGAFSRLRNSVRSSRLMSTDEDFGFLERRSLTPHTLISPGLTTTYQQNESTIFEGPLPVPGRRPSTPSSISGATDTVTISSSTISTREAGRASTERGWRFGRRKQKAMGDVFGVDLIKSIEIAPARIRISHNGRSNSHRKFPLSVHKCCEFIKASGEYLNKDKQSLTNPCPFTWNVDQLTAALYRHQGPHAVLFARQCFPSRRSTTHLHHGA